jgi:hypothetical protein
MYLTFVNVPVLLTIRLDGTIKVALPSGTLLRKGAATSNIFCS